MSTLSKYGFFKTTSMTIFFDSLTIIYFLSRGACLIVVTNWKTMGQASLDQEKTTISQKSSNSHFFQRKTANL